MCFSLRGLVSCPLFGDGRGICAHALLLPWAGRNTVRELIWACLWSFSSERCPAGTVPAQQSSPSFLEALNPRPQQALYCGQFWLSCDLYSRDRRGQNRLVLQLHMLHFLIRAKQEGLQVCAVTACAKHRQLSEGYHHGLQSSVGRLIRPSCS